MSQAVAPAPSKSVTAAGDPPAWTGAIYAMAFFSGAAALAYEIAWAKLLALTFGSTTFSASAVIAGFMGGMGLGAYLYHLVGDRTRRPLWVYGYLELGIAASTWLLTLLMFRLPETFARVAAVVESDAVLVALRFVAVLALLVIPAVFMGATFPALCRVLIRSVPAFDRHLGMIYGINTVGAAIGAVVAGVVLIEQFGLRGTVLIGNVTNMAVAATAFWMSGREESEPIALAVHAEMRIPTAMPRVLTGAVLLFSGMATLSFEILWFRALRYIVGNSTYALTIVLVIFLLGLGSGALLFRWVLRFGPAERLLAMTQCGIAALSLGAMAVAWQLMSSGLVDHVSVFSGSLGNLPWWGKLAVDAAVAAAIMLPAAVLMGLSFPLASRLFLGDIRHLGARVGGAYLLANIGSIAGAILAAVWLLPVFGTIGGTKVVAAGNLLLGLVLVGWLWRQSDRRLAPAAAVAAVLVAALALIMPAQLPLIGEREVYARSRIVFTAEGDLATVQVLDDPARVRARAMTIDGSVIGVSRRFHQDLYRKQLLLAHLPMALDARLRSALQIGLGSATTLDALAGYPEIERLDCVEINQSVADAAREFFEEGRVLDDPRVRLHVDDAMHFLLRTPERYDLIVSDGKQNPGFSGNATMLCREFYEYSLNRLTDDGLFIQWIPLGMLAEEFRVSARNFCDVFPEVGVFHFPEKDVLFVGSRRPLAGRPGLPRSRFESLPVEEELADYHLHRPDALLAHLLVDRQQLLGGIGEGPLSNWNHNIIEFMDFKATPDELRRAAADNLLLMYRAGRSTSPADGGAMVAALDPKLLQSTRLLREAYVELTVPRFDPARRLMQMAIEADPDNPAARAAMGTLDHLEREMANRPG